MLHFVLGLAVLAVCWACLFACCRWLEERFALLSKWNVSATPYSISLHSTRFNATISRFARRFSSVWRLWYAAGAALAVIGMILSVAFLFVNIVWLLRAKPNEEPVLAPVLPGVTVPLSDFVAYFVALLLAGIVHELGHAVAGVSHMCALEGMGLSIVVAFPTAYTELRSQDVDWSTQAVRLKVFSAGVWHNALLCLVAFAALAVFPSVCGAFYSTGRGVFVVQASGLSGITGGKSVISAVNGCPVRNEHDLRRCFEYVVESHQAFCISPSQLVEGEKTHDCCEEGYAGSLTCFHQKTKLYCLPLKAFISRPCNSSAGCASDGSSCLPASLPSAPNGVDQRIIWLQTSDAGNVAFAGSPAWLWRSLSVSNRVPKFAPQILGGLDRKIEVLLLYILSLSAALGILNMMPVHQLDGGRILDVLWTWVGLSKDSHVLEYIKTGTAILLGVNLVLSSRMMFR